VAQTPTPQRPTPGGVSSGLLIAGRYALSRLIASGGMAEVWQATDTVLERQVAVKILHAHLGADDQFVQRFRTEAVAAARLHHPAIVSIYDTCSDGGVEAIVMELVRGQTLRQYLDSHGPLPPDEVIDIGSEVADALEAAHRSGLVHRDIKPANILLCDDHRVMVTDFGIAKIRDDPDHTTTGQMLGTVKYLAPEQVEGHPVDGRTDVYALGVVLYESIAGRAPFVGDSQAATALARLHSTPPRPRQIRPSVPRALDDVVMRAMSREPDGRYPSAAELRAALLATRLSPAPAPVHTDYTPVAGRRPGGAAGAAPPRPPRPPRPRRRRRWLVPFLVFVVAALTLSIAGILLYRTKTGEQVLESLNNKAGGVIPGAPASGPLSIVDAKPFDPPPGDGVEGDAGARLVFDGNQSTGWHTEQYESRNLNNKPGVGLLLTLKDSSSLSSIKITSPTQDWSASIYVADKPGTSLADYGQAVGSFANTNGGAEVDLKATQGQYVLIWVTGLGNQRGGTPPGYSAEIDDVVITGH
jgi:serine/threonine protein kinase